MKYNMVELGCQEHLENFLNDVKNIDNDLKDKEKRLVKMVDKTIWFCSQVWVAVSNECGYNEEELLACKGEFEFFMECADHKQCT